MLKSNRVGQRDGNEHVVVVVDVLVHDFGLIKVDVVSHARVEHAAPPNVGGAGPRSARWSVPSTVSVILPCTKRSGTGRNCALSESRGVESRLKYFHGSPRT